VGPFLAAAVWGGAAGWQHLYLDGKHSGWLLQSFPRIVMDGFPVWKRRFPERRFRMVTSISVLPGNVSRIVFSGKKPSGKVTIREMTAYIPDQIA